MLLALPALRPAPGVRVWFLRDGEPVAVPRRAVGRRAGAPQPPQGADGAGAQGRDSHGAARPACRCDGSRCDAGSSRWTSGAAWRRRPRDAMLRQRVRQLVRTLDGVPGVLGVRVRVEGGVPLGLFPGFDLRGTVTAAHAAR